MNALGKLGLVLCALVLVALTAVGTAALKARFADGPTALFAGGPLISGPLRSGPDPDWAFTDDIETIELQLLEPATSRRTWVAQYDGKLYIESGAVDSLVGRLWFSWPLDAAKDGRAVVRIDGKRYPRQLIRIQSGPELDGITAAFRVKYDDWVTAQSVEDGAIWLFQLAPRPEGAS